uniref:Uncharacterized protein n=1 Tax=Arundo donax TaxID=35708 RepID=A0A0A9GUG1_ARUDO
MYHFSLSHYTLTHCKLIMYL